MEKAGEIAAWSRNYTFLGGVAASLAIYFAPLVIIHVYYPTAFLSYLPDIPKMPYNADLTHYFAFAKYLVTNLNAWLIGAAIWLALVAVFGGIWKSISSKIKR
jgi:hypothetical protein